MRSARAAHDEAAFSDREALRKFVDACQVLVGQLDRSPEESKAVVRLIVIGVLRRAGGASSQEAPTNFRVARVVRYLEDTFADPTIRLASAAQHVDVTPPHLDRLLKEHTGLTYLQQLRRIRMRHAERLLLTTASSVKETAYACGYTSTGSLDRNFRRVHGCSPSEWRDLRTAVAAQFTTESFRDSPIEISASADAICPPLGLVVTSSRANKESPRAQNPRA